MSEMIERVAKAKWARRQEVARKAGIEPPLADWDDEFEGLREEVRAETRAGFEAMLEPTEAMISAGDNCDDEGSPNDGDFGRVANAEEHYKAMIGAAL